ncbi:MAG: hypothetical protein MJ100_02435 [Ruminococcus sp.]|nr:hypothetical protein [Ruminococcus sp.]
MFWPRIKAIPYQQTNEKITNTKGCGKIANSIGITERMITKQKGFEDLDER